MSSVPSCVGKCELCSCAIQQTYWSSCQLHFGNVSSSSCFLFFIPVPISLGLRDLLNSLTSSQVYLPLVPSPAGDPPGHSRNLTTSLSSFYCLLTPYGIRSKFFQLLFKGFVKVSLTHKVPFPAVFPLLPLTCPQCQGSPAEHDHTFCS